MCILYAGVTFWQKNITGIAPILKFSSCSAWLSKIINYFIAMIGQLPQMYTSIEQPVVVVSLYLCVTCSGSSFTNDIFKYTAAPQIYFGLIFYTTAYLPVMNALASAMVSGMICWLVSGKNIVKTPPTNMVIPKMKAPRPAPNTVSTSLDCNIS